MNKKTIKQLTVSLSLFAFLLTSACASIASSSKTTILEQPQGEEAFIEKVSMEVSVDIAPEPQQPEKFVRGIHLSAWISGASKHRNAAIELFNNTELNTAVIDIKEMEGEVYIDGVKTANENRTFRNAIPNIKDYLAKLKENDIYTVARIVVNRDDLMPRRKPSMGVKNPDGTLWTDRKGMTWLDPYSKDAWEYILEIAERAVELGFEEIQFDYIRFPSDGNTKNCRYSNPDHSPAEASKAIVAFLKEANKRLKPKGVKISIDVFGLTTTANDDMGIGQIIVDMAEWVDYVSPMVYPSHYYKGEYGVAEPNKEPYIIVYKAMEGALKRIPKEKLRPWLQDFSMGGVPYGKKEVMAQIQACYDNDIGSWLLWNARCVYTRDALKGNDAETTYEKSDPPTPEMIKTAERLEQLRQAEEEKKAQAELAASEEKIAAEVESKQKKNKKGK
ncbi:MAG: putative glycoside hydrolase [Endomicrobia bacterium]|nr:putative glycoside hydrolase [Endomicrobiia bacterium]